MVLGKRIVFGVRVEGKVQWISIRLNCDMTPPAPLSKGGAREEEKSAIALLQPASAERSMIPPPSRMSPSYLSKGGAREEEKSAIALLQPASAERSMIPPPSRMSPSYLSKGGAREEEKSAIALL
jgi:hypothetical protein